MISIDSLYEYTQINLIYSYNTNKVLFYLSFEPNTLTRRIITIFLSKQY